MWACQTLVLSPLCSSTGVTIIIPNVAIICGGNLSLISFHPLPAAPEQHQAGKQREIFRKAKFWWIFHPGQRGWLWVYWGGKIRGSLDFRHLLGVGQGIFGSAPLSLDSRWAEIPAGLAARVWGVNWGSLHPKPHSRAPQGSRVTSQADNSPLVLPWWPLSISLSHWGCRQVKGAIKCLIKRGLALLPQLTAACKFLCENSLREFINTRINYSWGEKQYSWLW